MKGDGGAGVKRSQVKISTEKIAFEKRPARDEGAGYVDKERVIQEDGSPAQRPRN